jgi:SAM-dependent methyltransferase
VNSERRAYFEETELRRYSSEPHIKEIARFDHFRDRDVLEIGCGIGADGLQFSRAGSRYTGTDLTFNSASLAQERFGIFDLPGRFCVSNAECLPFPDETFDHVYSFGVIHHSPETDRIVSEIKRVLRPRGTTTLMVYNRDSINFRIEIMLLRKLFRLALYPSVMPMILAKLAGFDQSKLERHRAIMLHQGWNISDDKWLNINTDGPDCPLAKIYGRREVDLLMRGFTEVRTEVRHFDTAHWSVIGRVLPGLLVSWLGRHFGWHRIIYAAKPG